MADVGSLVNNKSTLLTPAVAFVLLLISPLNIPGTDESVPIANLG